MANTRTVTGTILKPDGTVYTDWAVKFALLTAIISDGDVIPAQGIEVTTANDGTFSVTLTVPDSGTASYQLILRNGYSQDFNLADGSSIDLSEILSIPTVAVDPNYITELTSLTITYTAIDLQITAAHEYVWSDGTVTITLPASTGSGDAYILESTLTIPVNTIAYYVDAELGNWHSNW